MVFSSAVVCGEVIHIMVNLNQEAWSRIGQSRPKFHAGQKEYHLACMLGDFCGLIQK